jgi:acyl dehydratase
MPSAMEFQRRPSVAGYMLRALHPSSGLKQAGGLPPIRAVWRRYRIDPRHLAELLELTGLRAHEDLPMLVPHVFGFPLQMVILTHRAFPLPIWRALQIRNHLLEHRAIRRDAEVEIETRLASLRVLDKGAEVDLHTTMRDGDHLVWESVNTFYYRGRFGEAGVASPLATAPTVGETVVAEFRTVSGVGWRFAALTGDYNGIHYWRWYARRLGFLGAFHHPQLVLGQCLAHLPAPEPTRPRRLDAWLKGPVYYGARVRLRATRDEHGVVFALDADGDERPAILGRLRTGAGADGRLLDVQGGPA